MTIYKIPHPDTFRSQVSVRLHGLFQQQQDQDQDQDKEQTDSMYAVNLERGIYNWAIREADVKRVVKKWDNPFFVQIYMDHLRSIYVNLSSPVSGARLLQRVWDGEIQAHEIAFMTHQQLNPSKWTALLVAKEVRDKNKFEQKLEANTDRYTCRKCRSTKCSYYQQQLRSADEPMTLFITCLDCGARWKQ